MTRKQKLWHRLVDDFLDKNMSGYYWRRAAVTFVSRHVRVVSSHSRLIIATVAIIALYRIGRYIPVPGVNSESLAPLSDTADKFQFGLSYLFSGGNLYRASIFTLGIVPYITASLFVQVAAFVWHRLALRQDTPYRPWDIRVTGVVAFLICVGQASSMALFLEQFSNSPSGLPLVYHPGLSSRLVTTLTLTSGTVCLIGLSDYITLRGIANGMRLTFISAVIAGLLSRSALDALRYRPFPLLIWLALSVGLVVLISRGYRRALLTSSPSAFPPLPLSPRSPAHASPTE